MTSFLKVLTHAENTDNHCWSAVMQYFECVVPKTFLFMPPLFKKQKSHKSSNLSYPYSRKVLTSAKIMISGQKCCRHLMLDSVKYFVHNLVTVQWTPSTHLTSKKHNPCWVNIISGNFEISNRQVTELKREIKIN